MCLQQKKYGFMLITRNVFNYIMYLIGNYCEFNCKHGTNRLSYEEVSMTKQKTPKTKKKTNKQTNKTKQKQKNRQAQFKKKTWT